jgi:hypothetical protein
MELSVNKNEFNKFNKYCQQTLTGAKVENSDEYERLIPIWASNHNLPKNKRQFCEAVIRNEIKQIDSKADTSNLFGQRLAMMYEHKLAEHEERERQIVMNQEAENLRRRERDAMEFVQNAIQIYRDDIKNELKMKYAGTVKCQNNLNIISENVHIFINDHLEGRKCQIPSKMWNKLFNDQPIKRYQEYNAIQADLMNLGFDMQNYYDDEQIENILGPDRIVDIIGIDDYMKRLKEQESNPDQVQLRITGSSYNIYAIISGQNDYDDIVLVSPTIFDELNISDDLKLFHVTDCILQSIKSIKLNLLYDKGTEEVDIDYNIIKEMLIDEIMNLGIIQVADILTISANDVNLQYQIMEILVERDYAVESASISKNPSDINIELNFEDKGKIIEEIKSFVNDEDLIDNAIDNIL